MANICLFGTFMIEVHLSALTLTVLNLGIPCLENSVDKDQLASQKPADHDPHCFICLLVNNTRTSTLHVKCIQIWEECSK